MRKLWSDPIKEMNEYMKKCISIYSFPFFFFLFIRTSTPTRICYSYGTLGDEVSSWNLHELSKPLEIPGQQICMKVWVSVTIVQFLMKIFQWQIWQEKKSVWLDWESIPGCSLDHFIYTTEYSNSNGSRMNSH